MKRILPITIVLAYLICLAFAAHAVPPPAPEPEETHVYTLKSVPSTVRAIDDGTRVFLEIAPIIGTVTNDWQPLTNFSALLTEFKLPLNGQMGIIRGYESNSVRKGDYFFAFKPADPANRTLQLLY